MKSKGKVYLVGAGPGDPGLITVKGKECIEKADVIIYDYLASPALLGHAPDHIDMIYVGKKGGDHTLSQDGINALLVKKAREGLVVTRLKGGDPFIFGRGGEEAEVLVEAGIPFEIVPGVTSAIAAPAYAGIPLTHRKFTATLTLVTGHEDPEKEASNIDWDAISKSGTLVFLMGVKNLPLIVKRLVGCGKPQDTPVALVRWGTTSNQQTVTGTLETIVDNVRKAQLKSPSIIVVGQVVSLRDTMQWFENKPLFGKRMIITRARKQASDLVKQLSDLGAHCIEAPSIRVVDASDPGPMDQAILHLKDYDWIVFTSVNGVHHFFERLFALGHDVRRLHTIKTACIGPATAQRLRDFGLNSDIIPESYQAESVVTAFQSEAMTGQRVLIPRAKEARPVLPIELRNMGAHVDEVTAYETLEVTDKIDELIQQIRQGDIDVITFTSSSTAKNFAALLPKGETNDIMKHVTVACIGPITAETAQELGFHVGICAENFTIPGLTQAILDHYQKTGETEAM
ncbi:MAG: uroporphyrinogen-III C-methyltransferase [Proteobacteria bacterium]|nr:uroporphyrinogen-III C-methyltransferase [Pseudomonadota bacterium]